MCQLTIFFYFFSSFLQTPNFKPVGIDNLKSDLQSAIEHPPDIYIPNILLADDVEFQKIVAGLTFYQKIHGHFDVPSNFKVPKNSELYPKISWNVKLGELMQSLKIRGGLVNTEARRKSLRAIGFDLKSRV
jgi:hypothetical protein